jgi:hypothetical protein
MPRKSAAALSIVQAERASDRLKPRVGASPDVKAIFHDLVAQINAEHFRPTDGPLLEQYAQAISLGRQAYAALEHEGPVIAGRANPWLVVLEKAHRSAAALSARLRLSLQHRTDPKSAGRATHDASAYDVLREWEGAS